jgi:hypothetical protein
MTVECKSGKRKIQTRVSVTTSLHNRNRNMGEVRCLSEIILPLHIFLSSILSCKILKKSSSKSDELIFRNLTNFLKGVLLHRGTGGTD